MTWVKICGMTNLEDALVAVEAGADAVGFVFYEKSPRCVTVETARGICEKLPESVEKVGVFVGAKPEKMIETSNYVGLSAAQIYPGANGQMPDISDEFLQKAQCDVIIALQAHGLQARALDGVESNGPSAFLLSNTVRDRIFAMLIDSGNAERPGGTGERFDWEDAAWMREGTSRMGVKLIVAGGLTSMNVGEAMGVLKPWGVDVASGVEARPGKKDPEKVRAFVRAVRERDRRVG
jgi:phosphoribosylanthranilate isomerase